MSGRRALYQLWRAVYPVLLYLIIQVVVSAIFSVALLKCAEFGWVDDYFAAYLDSTTLILLISALIGILIFGLLYRGDSMRRHMEPTMWQESLLWVLIGASALALLGNNLMSLTPLAEISESYQETSAALETGSIWVQIACVGFAAPAVEELVMRGLLDGRLREILRPSRAIFFSALIFGVFHGNIVQGVYAFALGIFFAWLMERYRTIFVPILAHVSANLFVTALSDSGLYDQIFVSVPVFLLVTVACALVFAAAFRQLRG
ncbi:MAG: CPBP family intramembrane metalloprotease [Lachnospiraceae bacterium]|nr:CPBP family intramembrane metalloprotease [Lachnospiraceae bacterium]